MTLYRDRGCFFLCRSAGWASFKQSRNRFGDFLPGYSLNLLTSVVGISLNHGDEYKMEGREERRLFSTKVMNNKIWWHADSRN
jgi:hypothetical protein